MRKIRVRYKRAILAYENDEVDYPFLCCGTI